MLVGYLDFLFCKILLYSLCSYLIDFFPLIYKRYLVITEILNMLQILSLQIYYLLDLLMLSLILQNHTHYIYFICMKYNILHIYVSCVCICIYTFFFYTVSASRLHFEYFLYPQILKENSKCSCFTSLPVPFSLIVGSVSIFSLYS